MSVNAHIQQLQERHQSLEAQLESLSSRPSVSETELAEVKRQKLRLKDKIHKLQSA